MSAEISISGGALPADIRTIGTLSGGAGSWGASRRWIDEHGPGGMVLIFTDVGGDPANPNTGEDEDTIRFLGDAQADLGVPLITIRDGRDIWDVFREKKWLGNARLAHCSWELKTGPARDWIGVNAPDAERILIGLDATELHRLPDIAAKWAPLEVITPLNDKPRWWKPQLIQTLRDRGIRPPRMYELGFAHANCPGCHKAGLAHWARLLRVWPERYAYAEQQEREFRAQHGDVSILRDRTGGATMPLTLERYRERLEYDHGQGDLFDEGGCACFA